MRKNIITSFFLLLFLSINFLGNCQPTSSGFGVTNWGKQSGINTPLYKTTIAIDGSGNKWIGSGVNVSTSGVQKFDGTNWALYNVASGSLPSNDVTSIVTNGNIVYVGTQKGIAKYENGNWSVIDTTNSQIASNVIKTLFFGNNTLWIGTIKGVSKLTGNTWTNYNTSNSQLCNNNIQAIEQTANGDMWFGTVLGLSKLSGTSWTTFDSINSGLLSNNITALCSNNNRIFIGSNTKGAFLLENNIIKPLFQLYPELQTLIFNPKGFDNNIMKTKIFDFTKDANGNIYFCTAYRNNQYGSYIGSYYSLLVQIKSNNNFNIFHMPSSTTPMYLKFHNNDSIWFVCSSMGNYSVGNPNFLYSIKLSKGILHDDYANLDINNVKAGISSSGFLFNDYSTYESPYFNIPKDSICKTIFSGNLWVGAKDNSGNLHLTAERYRSNNNDTIEHRDYQSGPISNDINIYNLEKEKWNHIWKVSKSEIDYHNTHYNSSGYIAPQDILSWPGNGNISYGQAQYLAPYSDANGNGLYDPQNGDYPIIRGDQALYFIFNDDRSHTESKGVKLSVEIHGMAYAYNNPADTALNNSIFINYRIYNRSQNNYDSLYIGSFTDFDIGYQYDDYVGCDTNLSMYYAYNGRSIDGSGQRYAYEVPIPTQGVAFLNNPMSSFVYYNSSAGPTGEPAVAIDYYNYMKSIWRDNRAMTYGGDGHGSGTNASNIPAKFMFPSNPTDTSGWNEITANNAPSDRRGLGSTGPYSLQKDSSLCMDLVYTFARNYSDTINTASVTTLKQYVQHIRNYYTANLIHNCSDLFSSVNENNSLKSGLLIYPNPASNKLSIYMQQNNLQYTTVSIYNIQGQLLMQQQIRQQQTELNISQFAKGIYIVKVQNEKETMVRKFVKE
jgi:hypothetical protein